MILIDHTFSMKLRCPLAVPFGTLTSANSTYGVGIVEQ